MSNFSFTITLKPNLFKNEPEVQYDKCVFELFSLLNTLTNNYTLIVELTKNMNLHMHGIIELHHKKKWYTTFRNSDMFGFTVCREIYDLPKWIDYISKSIEETYKELNRRPIIKDKYQVFTPNQMAAYGCSF